MAGYHVTEISRGKYGELSKINEEVQEAIDAEQQKNRLMVLIELSDIVGAIHGYLDNYYKGQVTFEDLVTMSKATARAFKSGTRK